MPTACVARHINGTAPSRAATISSHNKILDSACLALHESVIVLEGPEPAGGYNLGQLKALHSSCRRACGLLEQTIRVAEQQLQVEEFDEPLPEQGQSRIATKFRSQQATAKNSRLDRRRAPSIGMEAEKEMAAATAAAARLGFRFVVPPEPDDDVEDGAEEDARAAKSRERRGSSRRTSSASSSAETGSFRRNSKPDALSLPDGEYSIPGLGGAHDLPDGEYAIPGLSAPPSGMNGGADAHDERGPPARDLPAPGFRGGSRMRQQQERMIQASRASRLHVRRSASTPRSGEVVGAESLSLSLGSSWRPNTSYDDAEAAAALAAAEFAAADDMSPPRDPNVKVGGRWHQDAHSVRPAEADRVPSPPDSDSPPRAAAGRIRQRAAAARSNRLQQRRPSFFGSDQIKLIGDENADLGARWN